MRFHRQKHYARDLRHHQTEAEAKAWSILRNRRLLGLKFRRQHAVRGFVVDFYCHDLKLVLEVDGGVHSDPDQIERDAERDQILQGAGYEVLRIPNAEVTRENLVARISPPSADRNLTPG